MITLILIIVLTLLVGDAIHARARIALRRRATAAQPRRTAPLKTERH